MHEQVKCLDGAAAISKGVSSSETSPGGKYGCKLSSCDVKKSFDWGHTIKGGKKISPLTFFRCCGASLSCNAALSSTNMDFTDSAHSPWGFICIMGMMTLTIVSMNLSACSPHPQMTTLESTWTQWTYRTGCVCLSLLLLLVQSRRNAG